MSNDQADMYHEVIIDHGRHPYNLRKLENAIRAAEGVNSLRGDQLTVHLELTAGRINDIAVLAFGGAISQNCASLMSEVLSAKSGEEAVALFGGVHGNVSEESDAEVDLARLGSLAALPPVSEFPMWIRCATLEGTHFEVPSTTPPRGPGGGRG